VRRAPGDGPDDPVSDASSRATVTDTKRNSSTGVEKDDDASVSETKVDLLREFKNGVMFGETMRKRFTEARIDDKGLPIADALVVTTVPVFVATCVLALGVPRPSWLVPAPWIPKWRSLPYLAPALSHGAKLSCAWIPGALAAKAYEREAYDGSVNEAVWRTVKAGCFAIGILILATQIQLNVEFAARGARRQRAHRGRRVRSRRPDRVAHHPVHDGHTAGRGPVVLSQTRVVFIRVNLYFHHVRSCDIRKAQTRVRYKYLVVSRAALSLSSKRRFRRAEFASAARRFSRPRRP
jgi:hypothetical protein